MGEETTVHSPVQQRRKVWAEIKSGKKSAEAGDKYPKTYTQNYDPDIEHEKKSRLSK